MINKLIAIAAIVMAPSLASAQATGGTSGGSTGGNGGGQAGAQTNSATSGGSAASNPPRTEQQRRHDSLVTQMRNQRADTGNVQQFNGALSDTTDTTRRDTTRSDTTMMNRSDTTMMNRSDTSMMNRSDTSMNRADTTDTTMNRDTLRSRLHPESTATDTSTTTVESHGGLYTPNRSERRGMRVANMGLSTDQVKELQQAINDAGCHAGPVDGVIGHETREGLACVREEKGVQGDRMNDVLSALGLGFTASPNARLHAPRHGRMNRGGSMNRSDTTTSPSSYQSDTTSPSSYQSDTTTNPYQSDTTTTPTMDTTRSVDSSMASDTTRSMDTTQAPDTTMSRDTSSVAPPSTTNPTDSTMNPMNPMHPTDTTLNRPDTSSFRPDTSGV